MKLKLDANGNAVLQEVNGVKMPVYTRDDNTDAPFDAAGTVATLASRTQQAQRVETENKELKAKLTAFAEITDPAEALKAIGIVKNLDAKKLVDAGEIDKVKGEVAKVYDARIADLTKANEGLTSQLYSEIVGGAFTRSKVITDKFAIPADLVQARFGDHFGIKDGRVYATDKAGNELYSKTNPGALADFDEALMILVDQYPYKDQILKGTGGSGSGASNGGGGGGAGGKKTYTRGQFDKMTPVEQGTVVAAVGKGEATLVD
jgi:soluble cytochrome b562